MFIYMCAWPFYRFKILNFNSIGGFFLQKNAYFRGMMKLWIFYGAILEGPSQNRIIIDVIYIHFRVYS